MNDVHPFHEDMTALGFKVMQEDRKGVVQYAMRATKYLTYWLHWDPGKSEALFTWELDIGEFMHDHEMQIGANETLNIFLFPKVDVRGPDDVRFVAGELDRVETALRTLDLTADR